MARFEKQLTAAGLVLKKLHGKVLASLSLKTNTGGHCGNPLCWHETRRPQSSFRLNSPRQVKWQEIKTGTYAALPAGFFLRVVVQLALYRLAAFGGEQPFGFRRVDYILGHLFGHIWIWL